MLLGQIETLWTLYVVDNNMPFTSSDGFCDVVKTMFADSKIAQDFCLSQYQNHFHCKDMIENSQKEHFNSKCVFT